MCVTHVLNESLSLCFFMEMRIRMAVARCSFIAKMQWTLFAPAGILSPSS